MININDLQNSAMVKELYRKYYVDKGLGKDHLSSHWSKYTGMIDVQVDSAGNLVRYEGAGFGDLGKTNPINKMMKYLCNFSYLAWLPYDRDKLCSIINDLAAVSEKMGGYFSYDYFKHACVLYVIRQYFKAKADEAFDAVVIGDGYGYMASIIKKFYPRARITLIDLGRVLFFQAVNLQRAFSNSKHVYIRDGQKEIDNADFVYVSAEDLGQIKQDSYKLSVNIASMQEMAYKSIIGYFDFLRSHSHEDNMFYCLNRVSKTLPGGEIIEFDSYPWDESDKIYLDELCPFYKYYLSSRPPFYRKFDGEFKHRLVALRKKG